MQMPRRRTNRTTDTLRVHVVSAEIVPRVRSGRPTIHDVALVLRKPAGELTRAWISLATLRAHGHYADGRLSIVGGEYLVALRGLGDGRSLIVQWGCESAPTPLTLAHERDLALSQLRGAAEALGIDPTPIERGDVVSLLTTIRARLSAHETTLVRPAATATK